MDVYENGVCVGHSDPVGPLGEPGLPGADWNDGKGGDRGIPGPDYGGNNAGISKKDAHAMPWYVAHIMRQQRRQNRVN